ncbi:MAG: GNAT family N-acetyltransferase [Planctomyces sp.]|nr:GNAT family N-acetyltransferase [Planctomyces sp.]
MLQLWHSCNLGPSAAEGFSTDILELFTFSLPFFDRKGLILAFDDEKPVGFVHAGFAPTADLSGLDYRQGTLAALMVLPAYRRKGIGSQLVRLAEQYLAEKGAAVVEAGGGREKNGFYVGMYGGLQPSGFSESSAAWDTFFSRLGYSPGSRTIVVRRDLFKSRDPVNARLIRNRRQVNLVITDRPSGQPWWWFVRFGHLDSLRFELEERASRKIVASGQIIGMDVFIPKWGVRSVGIRDVFVPESERRHGYALALVLEICRRLRDEAVQLIEAHVDAESQGGLDLFTSANFEPVEHLLTFRRTLSGS